MWTCETRGRVSNNPTGVRHPGYDGCMTPDSSADGRTAPWQQWALFEKHFGTRARASDADWARSLLPADRLAIVEELFNAAYAAHQSSDDWNAIDERAWRDTLAERRRLAAAFHRLDEVQRGCTPLADAG
jgi:hypothetical protein